jgi:tetratricopeptide (TPR) repeat protein
MRRAPGAVTKVFWFFFSKKNNYPTCLSVNPAMSRAVPSNTAPLLNRAAQLLQAGRARDAIPQLREAARLDPSNATIQHDLGLACLEAGALPEAVAAFQRAIASKPRYTDAHFRLGIALEKAGDARGAVAAYDRATELLPSLTEAWYRAGALVYTMGHPAEAAGCFRRAAATGPKTSFGRLGAARALLAEDRDEDAEKLLRQLLALDPANAVALDLLGNLLADSGRFEAARECFARAIAAAPLMAGSYYDLVRCRRLTAADAALPARMQSALETPGLDAAQRLRVHLALGKAADDFGDYATAMRHFDAAEALRRATVAFDSRAFEALTDRIIARFTPALIARAPELGSADATPILIVGMPRSGTTLVEQILSNQADVTAGGELNFWPARGRAFHEAGEAGTEAAFLHAAAADYLTALRAIGPDAAHVTDKMPFNFIWAGLIHLAFPRALIIHCRRAAIDVALSIHQTNFNPLLAFPTGGADLVTYFRCHERLTGHWRRVLPADRFIDVQYETMTGAPEAEIRRIVAAAGLAWDDACLHPENNDRLVKTPSKWQARQPIYRSAVERWRRYEPFLGVLRELQD